MANDSVILRFSDVTFEYSHNKPILDEVNFSERTGSRITLMGQNGAGKSSLFKMITGEIVPQEGQINRTPKDASIAIAITFIVSTYVLIIEMCQPNTMKPVSTNTLKVKRFIQKKPSFKPHF